MIPVRTLCALVLAFTVTAASVRAVPVMPGEILVTPLVSDGQVSASFNAPDALADTQEVIGSGLLLTFTFTVELRRASSVWFDRTLAASAVAASVKYDNLTGTYQVSRTIDDHVVRSERTRDTGLVRTWMTSFERILLAPDEPLEPNADYYVRVRLRTSPRRTLSLWPPWPFGDDDGVGRAEFTFIR